MSTHGRERATESFWLLLSYVFFPLALPYANWAQPAVLFYLKSSGPFFDLPLFYFHRLSPSLSFQFSSVQSLSRVRLFAIPWTVAHQAPLSMGFSRQEYWSGLPLPSPTVILEPPRIKSLTVSIVSPSICHC